MNTSSKSKIRALFLRKKPNHKEKKTSYKLTNGQKQKKIEPWALGGVYGQHQLLKSDTPETPIIENTIIILPISEKITQKMEPETETEKNGDIENKNNMATLPIKDSDRKKFDEDSIDSITKFIEDDTIKLKEPVLKLPEIPYGNGTPKSVRKNKRSRRQKKRDRENLEQFEEEDKDKGTVKCLYVALMCCECSIS